MMETITPDGPIADPLLSVEELAAVLHRSVAAIRLMRNRGQLPTAVKIGNRVFWRRSVIEAFLDDCAEAAS